MGAMRNGTTGHTGFITGIPPRTPPRQPPTLLAPPTPHPFYVQPQNLYPPLPPGQHTTPRQPVAVAQRLSRHFMFSTMVGGRWRMAAVGGWRVAIGGWWRLVVLGGGWWLVISGWSLLAGGSGWRLAVGRRWWLAAVGGGRLVAVGGWRLAVCRPLGGSLRAVLRKKNSRPLRTAVTTQCTVGHSST